LLKGGTAGKKISVGGGGIFADQRWGVTDLAPFNEEEDKTRKVTQIKGARLRKKRQVRVGGGDEGGGGGWTGGKFE